MFASLLSSPNQVLTCRGDTRPARGSKLTDIIRQVLTHAARAAPLVAARGAREGLWLEQLLSSMQACISLIARTARAALRQRTLHRARRPVRISSCAHLPCASDLTGLTNHRDNSFRLIIYWPARSMLTRISFQAQEIRDTHRPSTRQPNAGLRGDS